MQQSIRSDAAVHAKRLEMAVNLFRPCTRSRAGTRMAAAKSAFL
jgi:hypothetical protein